jgi:hypothetical protein
MSSPVTPGDFSFMRASPEAALYKNAYDAIESEGLWGFFRDKTPPTDEGYAFWDAPELMRLRPYLLAMNHSGTSYALTMRTMERIAKNGWEAFVAERVSPMPPPPPTSFPRRAPVGDDPYAEARAEARAAGAAGTLCPTNQHGCLYFSRSEWAFCPMCEWSAGASLGRASGLLGELSVLKTTCSEEAARGDQIILTLAEANQMLKDHRAFTAGGIRSDVWARYSGGFDGDGCHFTRSEVHNLFMEHGCPLYILTDENWAAIKSLYA